MREKGDVDVEGNSCNSSLFEELMKYLQSSNNICAASSDDVITRMFFELGSCARLERKRASAGAESPLICNGVPGFQLLSCS